MRYRVLSIDAWRTDCGWDWNNWFHVGNVELTDHELESKRRILRRLREEGVLTDYSKGRVRVEFCPFDMEEQVEIRDRHTYEPLIALEPIIEEG